MTVDMSTSGEALDDPTDQGADAEDERIGDDPTTDHGCPQPARDLRPPEHVVSDHAEERYHQHHGDPGDGGAAAEVVAAREVPQGQRDPREIGRASCRE